VPDTFRKKQSNIFKTDNIKDKAYSSLISGLIDECQDKEYIPDNEIDELKIKTFVDNVWFVVDDKEPQDYIREIVKEHPKIISSDSELIGIFNEIRNKQSEKKNSLVEGIVIDHIDDVLDYGRHLTSSEIKLLVLQRIISNDPLAKSIPEPFYCVYNKYPEERRKMMLQECQSSLCCALFNKSTAQGFWNLFGEIYDLIMEHPDEDINYVYRNIKPEYISGSPDFDVLSLKYFIAKIKEGILQ